MHVAAVGSQIASILAVAGAAWWFVYTTKFKPRLQFDLNCHFIQLRRNVEQLICEIQLIFENKGFVEHRFWNLNISVHALDSEETLTAKGVTQELEFKERLLPRFQLVPEDYEYYFVRPGVRQVITHIISIPASVSAIRVTASFDYDDKRQYPHTARRVFDIQ